MLPAEVRPASRLKNTSGMALMTRARMKISPTGATTAMGGPTHKPMPPPTTIALIVFAPKDQPCQRASRRRRKVVSV